MTSLADFLESVPVWFDANPLAAAAISLALLFGAAALAYAITRHYLLRLIEKAIRRSDSAWDDALLENHVLPRVSLLAPFLVIHRGLELLPHLPENVETGLQRLVAAGLALTAVLALSALLSAVNDIYSRFEIARGRPIKGYLQIVKIFVWIIGLVLVIAFILDRSPLYFVTGIGAATAVLLLIFRDTILSFVASIQIMQNDMVRLGDWIEMPKYGADGDVVDIALHTIKVQNWDKTITTIPTYKLIEDSFRNWRGMTQSGGRRIKRAVSIDMSSIHFLDGGEIARFEKFVLLSEYIAQKKQELAEDRAERADPYGLTANARRLTNIGTFRAYLLNYLKQREDIHSTGMTFLVRHLQPSPEGLPIEIYVFTRDTRWVRYEEIQADIFDHILAMLPEFGLRVYQQPTGWDFARAEWREPSAPRERA